MLLRKWSTAGTNRVCSRCLALKDTIVGYTDESGVTIPPLHPRCRCAIIYDEVEKPRGKPKPLKPETKPETKPTPVINPLFIPVAAPVVSPVTTPKPEPNKPKPTSESESDDGFVFDVQRFGAQSLPEGNYNLTIRRQVQNRHIEGTREFKDYASRLAEKNLLPSKMPQDTDIQSLIKEFHGKGIYTPNPKDDSPREKIDTGRIIGQYWDTDKEQFVDTSWVMIVYSKRGTHIYPIRPQED